LAGRVGGSSAGNVHRLHAGDGPARRARDAFLQLAHLGRQPSADNDGDGMRPSSADTSEPACENRKMLSTNSKRVGARFSRGPLETMVKADRANAQALAPGGSYHTGRTPCRSCVRTERPCCRFSLSFPSQTVPLPSRVRLADAGETE